MKHVVIIGGGAVGLCSAYYLTKAGHKVTVVDRDPAGSEAGCSYGNAGMIVPSHFIPLAVPGMITQGIKWMFNPESPFGLKPSLSPDLISWAWKFKKAANNAMVEKAKPVLRDLGMNSRDLFVEMSKDEELSLDVETKGLMMMYKTPHLKEEEEHVAKMANELGIPAEILTKEQVQAYEPELKVDVIGGVYYPKDAHLTPNNLIPVLTKYLEAKGVEIKKGVGVEGMTKQGNRITEIQTTTGTLQADEIIVAAGSWSGKVVKQLGITMPMQAGKGYSMTVPKPPKQLQIPSILLEARVAVTPMGEKLRFAGTMEIGGLDTSVNQKKVDGIVKSIPNFFPDFDPSWVKGLDVWSGLRPCSPDGLPYIGRFDGYENLIAATGHAMMGVSLAAVTGKLVEEVIQGGQTTVALNQLSPSRYN